MPNCAVFGCNNSNKNTSGISFFSFPKNESLVHIWLTKCKREAVNLKYATICSMHFNPECFGKSKQQEMLNYSPTKSRKLKSDAVPTLALPDDKISSVSKRKFVEQNCAEKRTRKSVAEDLVQQSSSTPSTLAPLCLAIEPNAENLAAENETKWREMNELILANKALIKKLQEDKKKLQSENLELREANETLKLENEKLFKEKEALKRTVSCLSALFIKG